MKHMNSTSKEVHTIPCFHRHSQPPWIYLLVPEITLPYILRLSTFLHKLSICHIATALQHVSHCFTALDVSSKVFKNGEWIGMTHMKSLEAVENEGAQKGAHNGARFERSYAWLCFAGAEPASGLQKGVHAFWVYLNHLRLFSHAIASWLEDQTQFGATWPLNNLDLGQRLQGIPSSKE